MKYKSKKIILIAVVLLVSLHFKNYALDNNRNRIFIVKSPDSVTKNLLVSNNEIIKKINCGQEFQILIDKYTGEEVLIKTNEMEQIEGPGGIWDDEVPPWTMKVDSTHEYFNIENMQQYEIDNNLNIEFVINGFGIITNYELKQAELDKLIDERKKEGTLYLYDRVIGTYSQYESNYNKTYDKVYDLKNCKIIELDKTFTEFFCKDYNIYGMAKDNNNESSYFQIINNFSKLIPISEEEYITIKDNNVIEFNNGNFDKDLHKELVVKSCVVVNKEKYYIVRDGQYKFVVDDEGKIISNKFDCDFLRKATYYSKKIDEVIFERRDGKNRVYFTIKKDLFASKITEDYTYNLTNRDFLIGINSCYALVDDEKNANIYNRNGDLINKIQYIKRLCSGEEIILKNFEVHDKFVCGTYIENKHFDNSLDYNSLLPKLKKYSFVILDGKQSFDYNVVSDSLSLKMSGKYNVIQNIRNGKIFVVDNSLGSIVKELQTFDNISNFLYYKIDDKEFYIISDSAHSNIYDENFNIFMNSTDFKYCIFGKELICVVKKRIPDYGYNDCILLDAYGKCINKFVIKMGEYVLFEETDNGDLVFVPIYGDDGNIKNLKVMSIKFNDGKNLFPIDEYKVDRMENDNLFLLEGKDISYIVDSHGDVVKKFDYKVEYIKNNKSNIFSPYDNSDKEKLIFHLRYFDRDEKQHNVILDYNGKVLIDDANDYKVNFYYEYYSYVKNDYFFVVNYDNSIIFNSKIESIK